MNRFALTGAELQKVFDELVAERPKPPLGLIMRRTANAATQKALRVLLSAVPEAQALPCPDDAPTIRFWRPWPWQRN